MHIKSNVYFVREDLFFDKKEDSIILLIVTSTDVVLSSSLKKLKQNWLNYFFFSFTFLK